MRHAPGVVVWMLLVAACDGASSPDVPRNMGEDAADESDAMVADAATTDAGPGLDASPDAPNEVDAGLTTDASMGTESDAATPEGCPPLHERALVDVPPGVLPSGLTHWSCDHTYVLTGISFVYGEDPQDPQVLTIDPGTMVLGQVGVSGRGFLVITRQGRIDARGTARAPIVFTSANPPGARQREDWGGITLLGGAAPAGTRRVEGFRATVGGQNVDAYLAYGPAEQTARPDAGPEPSDDGHDCGTLRYVRIEFASFNAGGAMGNESNALQLYACGWNTEVDFVQTHLSGDDGVEVFGGTVDLRHLVITGASDDSLDWDDGWRGRAQFLVAQQHGDLGDLGFEGGGSSDEPAVAPEPRLFNMTWVGSNGAPAGKVGGRLRGASLGTLRNHIFLGFNAGALDIGGSSAAAHFRAGTLSIRNSLFHRASASSDFPTGSDDTADDADPSSEQVDNVDEAVELMAEVHQNRLLDPELPAPFDLRAPRWVPAVDAPLGASHAETPAELPGEARPAFFDGSARHVGAFAPGGDDWTEGWTAYPAD